MSTQHEKNNPINNEEKLPTPQGPQGVDKDPEEDKPGEPGSNFTAEQKGKKVDADPAVEQDKPSEQ